MFVPMPKIPRFSAERMCITEKIDGTNASIIVGDGFVHAASKTRRLTDDTEDNFGFREWVRANSGTLLLELEDGQHYGEWAGPGIQRNPLGLREKTFFLFSLHPDDPRQTVGPCQRVPILYAGKFCPRTIDDVLEWLRDKGSQAPGRDGAARAEGIVIDAFGRRFKKTMDDAHKTVFTSPTTPKFTFDVRSSREVK